VNCGAISSGLIESELFGHLRGAFTGATANRLGKFEEANNGTIFLDEIGDLEKSAQVKLLRALEQGEIQRVGSDERITIQTRIIAATNRNLEEMVSRGEFREDLWFRINICPLMIPPLRERRDEIRHLLTYFFQEFSAAYGTPTPILANDLSKFIHNDYAFPGNIRELKNLAQYLAMISRGKPLRCDELPSRYLGWYSHHQTANREGEEDMASVRDDAERKHMIKLLNKHQGDVPRMCQDIGLSRARIYQILKKLSLRPSDFRKGTDRQALARGVTR
ncbi:MAG: sigma-54-dependent Fis family transcriptional regulator, partial [Magnetococcales bacterium]|nr:sigma-54-dependent Fis family transcriptional regulator [Magnetococcales bacterium]